MTLILGMSKTEGIYMSADYRVTDGRSGKVVNDTSIKFLTVLYPPDKGGPQALLAYTGLAILHDGTPTGTWLRETLRGESEVFDRSMAHLRARLDRDIAPLGHGLIINVLVIHGERRFFGGLSNMAMGVGNVAPRPDSFGYRMEELDGPFLFGNGSGAARIQADRHRKLLEAQLSVVPRRPLDHMRLLATVNRRIASAEKSVSPWCHVAFINGNDRTSPTSRTFAERGDVAVPFEMPVLIHGIDLSFMARQAQELLLAAEKGIGMVDPDQASLNQEFKRRP